MKRILWLALFAMLTLAFAATTGSVLADTTYTVKPGDSLWAIAQLFGITVDDIVAANDIVDPTFIVAGTELIIPVDEVPEAVAAASAGSPAAAAAPATTPAVAEETAVAPVAASPELLPNASFEGDWYFYLYNELQVPVDWQLRTFEGTNDLTPGSGGVFFRPEVRVVPAKDLPPSEHSAFIMDGIKTVKAFKGGAPTQFSMFTDVALQPGTYRLEVRFFADTVAGYERGKKIFSSQPLAAEMRFIVNDGGTDWQEVAVGQQNTLTYDFTVEQPSTVRLGAGFRNRYITANNGWFIDDWSLTAVSPAASGE